MAQQENFDFRGSSREWFGIWIVNLLLSVLTLGIYSAWAKVRTKKYFYQNTWVAGRNFDYHATGKQILIGRLIIIAALIAYSTASALLPPLALLMIIIYTFCFPLLILRSAAFNARNSSWANVRFNFHGEASQAHKVYLLYPILTAITFYTTVPFLLRAGQRFGINSHSLGKTRLHFDSGIWPFYKAFLLSVICVIAGLVVFTTIAGPALEASSRYGVLSSAELISMLLGYGVLIFAFAIGGALYQALIRNHIFANTTLGSNQHGFKSTVGVLPLMWITISNVIITVITLGLALPWAQVRMHNYLAANTFVLPNGSLDEFTGEIISDENAIGDAFSDIEGVELDLPI